MVALLTLTVARAYFPPWIWDEQDRMARELDPESCTAFPDTTNPLQIPIIIERYDLDTESESETELESESDWYWWWQWREAIDDPVASDRSIELKITDGGTNTRTIDSGQRVTGVAPRKNITGQPPIIVRNACKQKPDDPKCKCAQYDPDTTEYTCCLEFEPDSTDYDCCVRNYDCCITPDDVCCTGQPQCPDCTEYESNTREYECCEEFGPSGTDYDCCVENSESDIEEICCMVGFEADSRARDCCVEVIESGIENVESTILEDVCCMNALGSGDSEDRICCIEALTDMEGSESVIQEYVLRPALFGKD